jgi:hypothetical protein
MAEPGIIAVPALEHPSIQVTDPVSELASQGLQRGKIPAMVLHCDHAEPQIPPRPIAPGHRPPCLRSVYPYRFLLGAHTGQTRHPR